MSGMEAGHIGEKKTYVGSIAGADDQTAVQDELHVARATAFGAGS